MDATAWSRLAITIALSAGIAGCELLPEQPGMGGYAMRELDIHDLRLSGDVGPVDDIGGEPEATQAVSCPGELMFSFVTEDGDQTVELDLILNQVIPEMHPGETYRVQSDDGRRVEIDALVTGLDTEWSGSATNAEMVIVYLGMDRYEMAFAGLLLGDDGLPSEVSGTFRMVQAADAAEGLGDALPF